MALTAQTGIPCEWGCGDTLIFNETFADFSTTDFNAVLYLSLAGATPTATNATESGGVFIFTLSATATAALAPGTYDYSIRVTNTGNETATAKTGQIKFTPNLASAQTPSTAQAMVTLLESVLAEFAGTTKISVSFNSQSFTRANIGSYREEYTYWKARLIGEQRAAARARGQTVSNNYAPRFGGGSCTPFPCTCP